MEEIGVRGTKKEEEPIIDSSTLKAILYGGSAQAVAVKRRGIFSKDIPFRVERWGAWSEAIVESGVLKGLKFVDELSEVKSQVDDLTLKVESVKSELRQCREGISTILDELRERPITKQTELFEIDETLEVIKPIPVVVEEYSDEVIAAFPEIEIFGVGSGEAEAIRNLKKEIRKIFFELENIGDDELGKLPLSWKRVLLKVVKKIGNAQ
jgi:predicted DNA-binding antitoxin AbrB/MazE fold protein